MKRLFPVLLLTILIIHFSSCEKDDICVEGDTPLLVIGFYNFDDTTRTLNVGSLRIKETLLDTVINLSGTDRTSADSVGIPLRIEENSTQFVFIKRSADDEETGLETGLVDTLTFNYTVNNRFISRACGFVANYNDLDTTRQIFSTDWIKRISIVENDIESANAVHVKIFH